MQEGGNKKCIREIAGGYVDFCRITRLRMLPPRLRRVGMSYDMWGLRPHTPYITGACAATYLLSEWAPLKKIFKTTQCSQKKAAGREKEGITVLGSFAAKDPKRNAGIISDDGVTDGARTRDLRDHNPTL